jgi:hypothetical protein
VHGEAALKRLIKEEGAVSQAHDDPRVRRGLELLELRGVLEKKNGVPRFLNTVLGFELAVQEVVVGAFFRLWAEETARAKLDGTYAQAGILNIKGEKVEIKDQPVTYLAPPPAGGVAAADEGLALTGRGGGGGRGRGRKAAAAPAPARAPAPLPAPAPVLALKPPAPGSAEATEQQERQKLTVVALTLDRGLSYGHALQMLLFASHQGGKAGGSGFYLPPTEQDEVLRPLLAIQRASSSSSSGGGGGGGGGSSNVKEEDRKERKDSKGSDEPPPSPVFKVLWPDVGREAYIDLTQEELLGMRFLSPAEAEALWTQRYEGALDKCVHGRRQHCSEGRRLRTCHILTFNLTQHWQLVKKDLLKRKYRLPVLRAETTSGACVRGASCLSG